MSQPEFDLCVVGAGSGGIGAALAAARMGLSVLLIEKSDTLGGNAVRGGVHNWEPGVGGTAFPFEIYQRLRGIPGAVAIVRMARHCVVPQPGEPVYPGGEALPDPAATYAQTLQRHSLKNLSAEEKFGRSTAFRAVVFEPEAYSRVVGEMLAETGACTIRMNTAFREVRVRDVRKKNMNPLAKWFLIIGGALTLGGPAIGLLGTVFGMIGSFDTLEKEGVSDPEALASNIGQSLMSTAGGFVIGFIGFLILVAGIIILLATRSKKVPPPIPQQ